MWIPLRSNEHLHSELYYKRAFFCLHIFYWLFYYSCPIFSPRFHLCPAHPLLSALPCLSSCPWVIHLSSPASPFPVLFLTSPYFVSTIYASYFLYLFPQFSPLPLHANNPPCGLHFCDPVPVLVVCLVCFCLFVCFSRFSCW